MPVEVKAGTTGTLKSLNLFMKEKKPKIAVRFWQDKLSFYNNILSIPLYMAEHTNRLINRYMS